MPTSGQSSRWSAASRGSAKPAPMTSEVRIDADWCMTYDPGNVPGNMANDSEDRNSTPRVARHRLRATARGTTRVEISVPLRDAPLLRSLAQTLREEGARAAGLRQLLETEVVRAPAATGVELVDFLLASPLGEVELDLERDRSSGRPIDFE